MPSMICFICKEPITSSDSFSDVILLKQGKRSREVKHYVHSHHKGVVEEYKERVKSHKDISKPKHNLTI
jgi:hypothetical protein